MNLVYGSFCPIHEGNGRCPCRWVRLIPGLKVNNFLQNLILFQNRIDRGSESRRVVLHAGPPMTLSSSLDGLLLLWYHNTVYQLSYIGGVDDE